MKSCLINWETSRIRSCPIRKLVDFPIRRKEVLPDHACMHFRQYAFLKYLPSQKNVLISLVTFRTLLFASQISYVYLTSSQPVQDLLSWHFCSGLVDKTPFSVHSLLVSHALEETIHIGLWSSASLDVWFGDFFECIFQIIFSSVGHLSEHTGSCSQSCSA